jgi:hypothetical protein
MASTDTSTDQTSGSSQTDSKAQACDALELGWHMAELYHWSTGLGTDEPESGKPRLPRRTDLSPREQARLLSQQIDAAAKRILSPLQSSVTQSIDAVSSVLTNDAHPMIDNLRGDTATLHRQILQAITVKSSMLSKAYALGQSLAEMSLAAGTDNSADMTLAEELFGIPSIRPVYVWLSELKSLLPAHAAYAVSRTLEEWRTWIGTKKTEDLAAGTQAMAAQGRVWRELLTGEKSATDLLNVGHYLRAAQEIFGRVLASVKRYWIGIVIVIIIIAAVVAFIIELHHVSTTTKFITSFVWLAGVLGITVKGFGSLLGTALKNVEGWLWQGELDESVAEAAARLPVGVAYERLTGDQVGELIPAVFRSAELQAPQPPPDSGAHQS